MFDHEWAGGRVRPVAQSGLHAESHVTLLRQIEIAVLQAHLRRTGLHVGMQQAERASANLHVVGVELAGNLRSAG